MSPLAWMFLAGWMASRTIAFCRLLDEPKWMVTVGVISTGILLWLGLA